MPIGIGVIPTTRSPICREAGSRRRVSGCAGDQYGGRSPKVSSRGSLRPLWGGVHDGNGSGPGVELFACNGCCTSFTGLSKFEIGGPEPATSRRLELPPHSGRPLLQ
jgi:hypothetical protein